MSDLVAPRVSRAFSAMSNIDWAERRGRKQRTRRQWPEIERLSPQRWGSLYPSAPFVSPTYISADGLYIYPRIVSIAYPNAHIIIRQKSGS